MFIFCYFLLQNPYNGVPPAFWKKNTLRACKILYSFLANPITNENPKTHTMIGMYKKLHRLIKRKKGESLMEVRDFSLLPIIGRYVNRMCIEYTEKLFL
ncbi:hypothetical protein EJ131_28335 [Bacillus mycoides]|nr:hypothetical protein [Bacillus mycoides]